ATPAPPSIWRRVGRQLIDPLIALLLIAAAVTAGLGDWPDTAVILVVVVVNTTIGVMQEVRADRAITALHQLAAPMARVVRGGTDRMVPAAAVVRDDLIVLTPGDIVPADARLADVRQLRLDEAALTGESVPVARACGEEVFAGTIVVAGRAEATVVRTGADSALGRISTLVAATRSGPTPLQRRLAGLGRVLGAVAVGLSAVVMLTGILAGEPVAQMAITAVSLVVAAVPESLPAVVTLALALGAFRMAKGHALARRLHAVETLGAVTVIASDKTGTVTEGRMAVERVVTADGAAFRLLGRGYEPVGMVHGAHGRCEPPPPAPLLALARAAVLCNDAQLTPPGGGQSEWRAVGDPVEAALLAFAGRCGLDLEAERARAPRIAEEPFDATTRRMTTVHSTSDGPVVMVCKGAPEVVLDPAVTRCEPARRELLLGEARRLADAGLRVLAVAVGSVDGVDAVGSVDGPSARPTGLRPLGLLGIGDPVRDGVAEVSAELADAGIRLVMITGDHPATAVATATRMGIWRDGDTVALGDHDLPAVAAQARVFARTRPEQKLDIVAALQAQGQVVAMTGDGVNDAPALRRADIGVAMGAGGTEVARQAADLVLTDDNLATIAVAVREGRRIYDNIRRFLRYALAGGVAELAVMLIGPLVGLAVPLLPAQILWVNLLTHGVPGVAMGAEPTEPGVMRRPPRSPQESVLGGGLATDALLLGAGITTVVLAVALGAGPGAPWQSMAFVTLGLAQLGVALAVRAPRPRGGPGNPALGVSVAVSAALQIGGVAAAPLRSLLGTVPLSAAQLGVCLAAAALPGAGLALVRRIGRSVPNVASGSGPSDLSDGVAPSSTERRTI
ncbi:MAG: cation-translocating P-type ATPase, partial [Micromonosporaceae bacterium]